MNRTSRFLLIIAAFALILFDTSVLFDITQAKGGKQIFELVLENMFPCKALLGITGLLFAFEKVQQKIWAVITLIISGFMALIHTFALVVQIIDIANGIGTKTTAEYMAIADFVGEIILLIGVILLMVYVINGALKRTTLVIASIAFVVLIIGWIVGFYNVISVFSGDFSDFISQLFSGDLDLFGLVRLVSQIFVFATLTGVFDTLSKKQIKEEA